MQPQLRYPIQETFAKIQISVFTGHVFSEFSMRFLGQLSLGQLPLGQLPLGQLPQGQLPHQDNYPSANYQPEQLQRSTLQDNRFHSPGWSSW